MRFEDALQRAREGCAIARQGKDYYLKIFPDGMYIGIFATPDKPLVPFRFLRSQSIMAEDWHTVTI